MASGPPMAAPWLLPSGRTPRAAPAHLTTERPGAHPVQRGRCAGEAAPATAAAPRRVRLAPRSPRLVRRALGPQAARRSGFRSLRSRPSRWRARRTRRLSTPTQPQAPPRAPSARLRPHSARGRCTTSSPSTRPSAARSSSSAPPRAPSSRCGSTASPTSHPEAPASPRLLLPCLRPAGSSAAAPMVAIAVPVHEARRVDQGPIICRASKTRAQFTCRAGVHFWVGRYWSRAFRVCVMCGHVRTHTCHTSVR